MSRILFLTCFFTIGLFNINVVAAVPKKMLGPKPFVVVLDAGHGGHDSGNRGNGYYEKNIALDIILQAGKILENQGGIKVIYTRKTDVFIPLNKRADIANKAKADLFVSVHCNAAARHDAYGTETFVLGLHANERNFNIAKQENAVILLEDDYKTNYDGFDPNSPESVIGITLMQEEYLDQSLNLASFVQSSFTKQLRRKDRGVKQAGFLVLHRTFMPSVLIETGFLTNKNEGKYLNSTKGKTDMANSIAKAVKKYKNSVQLSYQEESETPTSVTEKVESKPKSNSTKPLKEVSTQVIKKGIVFKVQIAAGVTKLDIKPSNFKGLKGVSFMQFDDVYRYYFGEAKTYDAIKKQKQEAIEKGFKSSFIVAFDNGKSIPLSKAVGL